MIKRLSIVEERERLNDKMDSLCVDNVLNDIKPYLTALKCLDRLETLGIDYVCDQDVITKDRALDQLRLLIDKVTARYEKYYYTRNKTDYQEFAEEKLVSLCDSLSDTMTYYQEADCSCDQIIRYVNNRDEYFRWYC